MSTEYTLRSTDVRVLGGLRYLGNSLGPSHGLSKFFNSSEDLPIAKGPSKIRVNPGGDRSNIAKSSTSIPTRESRDLGTVLLYLGSHRPSMTPLSNTETVGDRHGPERPPGYELRQQRNEIAPFLFRQAPIQASSSPDVRCSSNLKSIAPEAGSVGPTLLRSPCLALLPRLSPSEDHP